MTLRKIALTATLVPLMLVGCDRSPSEATPPTASAPAATPAAPAASDTPAAASPAALDASGSLTLNAGDSHILTQPGVGSVQNGLLASTGTSGFLVFGPYAALPKGSYVATFNGSVKALPGGGQVRFDVVSGAGAKSHGEAKVGEVKPQGVLAQFPITLAEDVNDLEVRVEIPDGGQVEFSSYSLQKQ